MTVTEALMMAQFQALHDKLDEVLRVQRATCRLCKGEGKIHRGIARFSRGQGRPDFMTYAYRACVCVDEDMPQLPVWLPPEAIAARDKAAVDLAERLQEES